MNTLPFAENCAANNIAIIRSDKYTVLRGEAARITIEGTLDSHNVAAKCGAILEQKRAPNARKALAQLVIDITVAHQTYMQQLRDKDLAETQEHYAKESAATNPTEIEVSTTKLWLYVKVGGIQLHFNRGEIQSKGMLAVVTTVGLAVKDDATKQALRQLWMAVKRDPEWWSADSITRRDYEWRVNDMLATTKRFGGTFASEKQASFYKEMRAWLAGHSQAA